MLVFPEREEEAPESRDQLDMLDHKSDHVEMANYVTLDLVLFLVSW